MSSQPQSRDLPLATSVVIPASNEAEAIGPVVTALLGIAHWHEILVVDDGSDDETYDRAARAGARVIRHPYNKGNGAAVKTGIRQATGEMLLIIDADGQHQPEDALLLVSRLDSFDLVVGARIGQSHASFVRRIGNRALNLMAGDLAQHPIPDL